MLLSIESSCDDSSIAITDIKSKKIFFHKKISQEIDHSHYGGVVPELAARLHAETLPKILIEALNSYSDSLSAIAVTTHPGLAVTLNEGVIMAKALALSKKIPLISVNHLKGHIYSLFIENEVIFPITVLLVSGGHTQVIEVHTHDDMKIVMSTSDDSFGESFDKVAKMMSLGYPGGPIVERYAAVGDKSKIKFPIPLHNSNKLEFSYSGLKNAVKLEIDKYTFLEENSIADICASFQYSAIEHLVHKIRQYFKFTNKKPKNFAVVGGASANLQLRQSIDALLKPYGVNPMYAQLQYCSDNAVMIGRCAIEDYKLNKFTDIHNINIQTKSLEFL